MNYIKVSVLVTEVDPYVDILIALLNEIDFECFQETDSGMDAYVPKNKFDETLFKQTISAMEGMVQYSYQISEIAQQNWNANWESSFSPIFLNPDCAIRADFHPDTQAKFEIVITPKMSFGTGHHATTFLMANQLFHIDCMGKTVLDMGSGTGILAILSEKLGATNVVGIDNDTWAEANAIENALLNNSKKVKFELGDANSIGGRTFDIILANINRNIILQDMHIYISALRTNGILLLSGFYTEDREMILKLATQLSVQLQLEVIKDNWLLLQFQR